VLLIRKGRNYAQVLLLIGSVIVLFYTYSRSAWIGAALSVIVVLFLSHLAVKTQKVALGIIVVLMIVAGLVFIGFRNNVRFQNFIFHTQTHSAVSTTSDTGHFQALKSGLHDLIHSPLGNGPGTAGPASVYNTGHPTRIAENYYIQIGQETGWLGLILYILINVGVGLLLYKRRSDPLALSLFACLIGLTFINLFSHAWADDTLAYVFWGMAGIAMAPIPAAVKPTEANIRAKPVKKA
jgi:O-antigen ligase